MSTQADDLNQARIRGTVSDPPADKATNTSARAVWLKVETVQRWWSNGEERRASEFHKVVVWDPACRVAALRLRKGDRVYLEGDIQTRRYEYGMPPQKGVTTEIVLNAGRATLMRLERANEGSPDEPTP